MSTVNNKMTAIADEIRELSGTTDPLGLDEMATHVGDANDEVTDQETLIAEIVAALEDKTAVSPNDISNALSAISGSAGTSGGVVSKNQWNHEATVYGYFGEYGEPNYTNTDYMMSDYIPFTTGEAIYFYFLNEGALSTLVPSTGNGSFLVMYDANKNFVADYYTTAITNPHPITNANVAYIRFAIAAAHFNNADRHYGIFKEEIASVEEFDVYSTGRSISAEIDYLTTLTNGIGTAITDKGVEVPDGTKLNGLAALIAAIETGGLPDGISAMASGTFTLTTSTYEHTITHGLGVQPNFLVAMIKSNVSKATKVTFVVAMIRQSHTVPGDFSYKGFSMYTQTGSSSGYSSGSVSSTQDTGFFTTTTATMKTSQLAPFVQNKEWFWVCGVIDGLV